MKANELRLNSLVNYTDDGDTLLHTILAITETEGILLECNGIFEYVEPEKIEPIPLTEEWLIKFGLNDKYYFAGDLRLIEDEEEGYYLSSEHHCGFDLPTVKHVHQLQNLYFALTNEELTIK